MKEVWIVYHDSGPDDNILGVFASYEEAQRYAEEVGPQWELGALVSQFPVPWRSTDQGIVIEIGP